MSEVWFCETHNYVFNADLEIDAETAGWMWYCPDAVIDEPVCVHTKMLLVSPNSLVVEKTGLGSRQDPPSTSGMMWSTSVAVPLHLGPAI